jgi:hypothetical protein
LPLETTSAGKLIKPNDTRTGAKQTQSDLPLETTSSTNTKATSELPPNEAGGASRGHTIDKMTTWLKRFENGANFSGTSRSPDEAAFGRLYRALRLTRDDVSASVLEEAGQKGVAIALRGSRDTFAKLSDRADELAKSIKDNPTEAANKLLKKGDTEQATTLGSALSPDSFKELGRALVGKIETVATEQGPRAALLELRSYTPATARAYLGNEGYSAVQTLLNAMEVLESRIVKGEADKMLGTELLKKAYVAAHHPMMAGGKLVANALDKMGASQKVKDFFLRPMNEKVSKASGAAGAAVVNGIGEMSRANRKPDGFASDMQAVDDYESTEAKLSTNKQIIKTVQQQFEKYKVKLTDRQALTLWEQDAVYAVLADIKRKIEDEEKSDRVGDAPATKARGYEITGKTKDGRKIVTLTN